MDQISIKTTKHYISAFLKLTSKGTWQQVGYLSEAPDPLTPPPFTHCMNSEYIPLYLFTQGRGGGTVGEPVRRLEER
jgi:hypothetical protein